MDDGVVGAGFGTLAALDTLFLIDEAAPVDERDGALGADLLAGSSKAVLAADGNLVLVLGAGVAGVGNDIDQGRLIILLGNCGGIHALGHQTPGLNGADAKAHGKANPLTGDGALQEDGFPVQGLVAGDDLIGQILRVCVVAAGVRHACDLGKDVFSDVCDERRDSSHMICSSNIYFSLLLFQYIIILLFYPVKIEMFRNFGNSIKIRGICALLCIQFAVK